MATPSGTGKQCVICGEDCSYKPRTKDTKGRYYCKSCHDQAVLKKREHAGAKQSTVIDSRPLTIDPEDGGAPSILEQLIDSAPQIEATAHCTKCGNALPQGGVVCTNCGFNAQTGSTLRVKVRKPPRQATGGVFWPWIVGIISMVLGGGGTLVYGLAFVMMLLRAFETRSLIPAIFGPLPVGSLLTALSLWLFRDGWRIVRRNSDGVKWIRFWALTKALIYGTCLSIFMAIPIKALDDMIARSGKSMDITSSEIKAQILLVMLWFLAWPLFILVFFFVPRIQNDVERWE